MNEAIVTQRDFEDLDVTIVATLGEWVGERKQVDFEVYKITAFQTHPRETPLWWDKNDPTMAQFTENFEDARVFFTGTINERGDNAWTMCEYTDDPGHLEGFNGRQGCVNLGLIFAACWDIGKELLDKHGSYVEGLG